MFFRRPSYPIFSVILRSQSLHVEQGRCSVCLKREGVTFGFVIKSTRFHLYQKHIS